MTPPQWWWPTRSFMKWSLAFRDVLGITDVMAHELPLRGSDRGDDPVDSSVSTPQPEPTKDEAPVSDSTSSWFAQKKGPISPSSDVFPVECFFLKGTVDCRLDVFELLEHPLQDEWGEMGTWSFLKGILCMCNSGSTGGKGCPTMCRSDFPPFGEVVKSKQCNDKVLENVRWPRNTSLSLSLSLDMGIHYAGTCIYTCVYIHGQGHRHILLYTYSHMDSQVDA